MVLSSFGEPFCPELARCFALSLFEYAVERLKGAEPGFEGDGQDRVAPAGRIGQHGFGVGHAMLVDVGREVAMSETLVDEGA